jgi:hypothetical protein
MPDFFIVGAPKCGTTSLAAWLAEHPAVFMSPIKEPFFFSVDLNNRYVKESEDYLNLFRGVGSNAVAAGEATTVYLFSRQAVPLIEATIDKARYIAMIRNPIDMAYSLHEQMLYSDVEMVEDFEAAWRLSPERRGGRQVPDNCSEPLLLDYQEFCKLGSQIGRLYSIVPRERVLVLVLDDMKLDPRKEYLKAVEFLDAPDDGRTEFPVYNPAKKWRRRAVGRIIRSASQWVGRAKHLTGVLPKRSLGLVDFARTRATNQQQRPPMPSELRAELQEFYENDISELEALLGRQFPAWREAGS